MVGETVITRYQWGITKNVAGAAERISNDSREKERERERESMGVRMEEGLDRGPERRYGPVRRLVGGIAG